MSRRKMTRDQLYEKEWVEYFDKVSKERGYKKSYKKILKIIKAYNPSANDVLELGCRSGRYTKYFVKSGFKVKATDASADAVKFAKSRVPEAKFEVLDMSKLKEKSKYDIIGCFYVAFRYNSSYAMAQKTLKNIEEALNVGGLFFCDFDVFPPNKKKNLIFTDKARIGNKIFERNEYIWTEGDFDKREDKVNVYERKLFRKVKVDEIELKRSPLLRIDEQKMKDMIEKAGMKVLLIEWGFRKKGESSVLFVGIK